MVDYIIYETSKEEIEKVKKEINKVMINYDIEYNIYSYIKIEELLKYNSNNYKIYILNTDSIKQSGYDISNYIRYNLKDWQSTIILQSKYIDMKKYLFDKKLLVLDFIDKNNNYKDRLKEDIIISISIYENRPVSLTYTYKKTIYNIKYQDIIYIEKEKDNKRSIINTIDNKYYIQKSLIQLMSLLDKRFIKCNKSIIINIEKVIEYNIKDNIIKFNDNLLINDISRDKKQIIINKLKEREDICRIL